MSLSEKVSKGVYAYGNLYIRGETPVIVYAPGRVGSMGMVKRLREAGVFSFKVESFINEPRGASVFCRKHILDAGRYAKIITPIRGPVALMASYFFSKAGKGWLAEGHDALKEGDVDKLQEVFIEDVLKTERLDNKLYWFEKDFAPSLGFSIFDYPFDTERKWSVIEHERFPTLIIRTDLPNEEMGRAIGEFLGTDSVSITNENPRSEREDGEIYQEFKEKLSVPQDILIEIFSSPYATHFFSPEEREELKKKWS